MLGGGDGPEPVIMLNGEGFGSIGAIADFASIFDDPMPADICRRLCGLSELGGEAPEDQTFAAGGQYLRKAYDELVSCRARARDRVRLSADGASSSGRMNECWGHWRENE
jgi:hypothetical protein